MQTLETSELTKQYDLEKEIQEVSRKNLHPVKVSVKLQPDETVLLTIGGSSLTMSRSQALDLAKALRQEAHKSLTPIEHKGMPQNHRRKHSK